MIVNIIDMHRKLERGGAIQQGNHSQVRSRTKSLSLTVQTHMLEILVMQSCCAHLCVSHACAQRAIVVGCSHFGVGHVSPATEEAANP